MMNRWIGIVSILYSVVVAGCAVSYIDDEGRHNVIGFAHVAFQGAEDNARKAGDKVEVTNVGVLFMQGKIHSGVSFGFNNEVSMVIKNDVLILEEDVRNEKNND